MRGFVSALVLAAAAAGATVPAAAQQQSGQQQMQERMQQMQERMGQGGMQGQMPRGQGMMGQGMMGQGMMGQGMMGQGSMRGMGPGRFVEGRLAFLEAELGIREDQEDAWQDFAEAMRANAGSMQRMHERMWSQDGRPETLPERLELHEETMSARLAAMREMRQALLPLYEALDDRQKETLEALMGMGMM